MSTNRHSQDTQVKNVYIEAFGTDPLAASLLHVGVKVVTVCGTLSWRKLQPPSTANLGNTVFLPGEIVDEDHLQDGHIHADIRMLDYHDRC